MALPNSTKIPTPYGFINIGDIKIGDYVFDADGNPTTVSGVFPQGKMKLYKVTFEDERSELCTADHLWEVYPSLISKKTTVFSTSDIMTDISMNINCRMNPYVMVVSKPVEFNEKPVPFDPYLYGAVLATYCTTEPLTIFTYGNDDIEAIIGTILDADVVHDDSTMSSAFSKDGELLTTSDIFGNESILTNGGILDEFIYNSYDVRMQLLHGMMDAVGSLTNDSHNVMIYLKDKNTVHDFSTLIESLGHSSSISKRDSMNEVTLNAGRDLTDVIFTIPSKQQKASNAIHIPSYAILRTEHVEETPLEEDCTCIYVENDHHLFLTEHFIPTHDTPLDAQNKSYLIRNCST